MCSAFEGDRTEWLALKMMGLNETSEYTYTIRQYTKQRTNQIPERNNSNNNYNKGNSKNHCKWEAYEKATEKSRGEGERKMRQRTCDRGRRRKAKNNNNNNMNRNAEHTKCIKWLYVYLILQYTIPIAEKQFRAIKRDKRFDWKCSYKCCICFLSGFVGWNVKVIPYNIELWVRQKRVSKRANVYVRKALAKMQYAHKHRGTLLRLWVWHGCIFRFYIDSYYPVSVVSCLALALCGYAIAM